MENKQFGALLKKKRQEYSLSQSQLAKKLHVSNKTISRWENNHGYPDIETIPKLVNILKLSYEQLLDYNTYYLKRKKRRQKTEIILLLTAVLIIVLGGYQYYLDHQKFYSEYRGKDLLVSEEMINQVTVDLQMKESEIATSVKPYYRFDQNMSNAINNYLDVDNLKEISGNHSQFIDGINQWTGTLHFFGKNDQNVLKIHCYSNDQETYLLFNQNSNYGDTSEGELYYLDHQINFDEKMMNTKLDKINYDHNIDNSSNLILMNDNETKEFIENNYSDIEPYFLDEDIILILKDQETLQDYLMVKSCNFDYQIIETIPDAKQLDVYFSGKEYMYYHEYLHLFKLDNNYENYHFYFNQEAMDDFTIKEINCR